MLLPSNLQTGRVEWRAVADIIDSDDPDTEPDIIPAQGEVWFDAEVSYWPAGTANTGPMTIVHVQKVGVLDNDGFLCSPDPRDPSKPGPNRFMRLYATNDPDYGVTGWKWKVTPRLKDINGQPLRDAVAAKEFFLDAGTTLDLTHVFDKPLVGGPSTPLLVAVGNAAAAITAAQQAKVSAEDAKESSYRSEQLVLEANARVGADDAQVAGHIKDGTKTKAVVEGLVKTGVASGVAKFQEVIDEVPAKVEAQVSPLVAQAIAADRTVADAAAVAVAGALDSESIVRFEDGTVSSDIAGGVLDKDNRATWLTHNEAGGPTEYSLSKLGIAKHDSPAAGGFLDKDNRETDIVFDHAGHVTDRVMRLWAARLGVGSAPKGLVTTDTRIMWGDSMTWGRTNGATPISAYLETLLGKTVVNKGVSAENSTQIMGRMLADTQYRDAVVYLWAARNDIGYSGNTPEKTVRNNRRMLEHMTAVRRRALVLEPSPWNGEIIGSATRTKANGYDNYVSALKAALPEYWVPLGSWMLTDAAGAAVGHTFTEADNTARNQGQVPPSFLSDNGHYNTLGNQAAAFRLHQEELDRGWI